VLQSRRWRNEAGGVRQARGSTRCEKRVRHVFEKVVGKVKMLVGGWERGQRKLKGASWTYLEGSIRPRGVPRRSTVRAPEAKSGLGTLLV
jgi:hypothetical protein